MCRACVNKLAKKEYPMCKASFARSRLKPMPFVQGMVWRLKVKCRQEDDGCDWTGELGVDGRNLKAHDDTCSRKPVKCDQCDQSVIQRHSFASAALCQTSVPSFSLGLLVPLPAALLLTCLSPFVRAVGFVRCTACQQKLRRWAINVHFKLTEQALKQLRETGTVTRDDAEGEQEEKEDASMVRQTRKHQ
jgi:hypothetical protein